MADNIVFNKFYGEIIHVDGKCWQFLGVDNTPVTHSSGEISAFYTDCGDCLTGGAGIPFSEISGSLLGDPHFLFGGSSPETASFNVDDNIGTGEVIWFTAVDADDNEIIVKYTCQEFINVDDGYNVDRLIIEDGSLSSVYEVSTDNSDVLKNGIIWNSEDSDIILGSNVWKMKVSSATVPSCPGDFSWIPFEFGPMSGMNNLKEVGGMWWYLWKKASTLSGTTLNNPSSAGFDGVSGFLNGFDGYSSRTDFEATPSSVRETFDQATMNEVSTKRNALALQSGTVDFGWDPTMDSPPSCTTGFAKCGTPNGNPTVLIKAEWTDLDVTKNFFGCTFTDGQTYEMYSTGYTDTSSTHSWRRLASANELELMAKYSGSFTGFAYARIDLNTATSQYIGSAYNYSGATAITYGSMWSSMAGLDPTNMPYKPSPAEINSIGHFGSATGIGGVTITWSQGSGW
jgi:hypothetical protein